MTHENNFKTGPEHDEHGAHYRRTMQQLREQRQETYAPTYENFREVGNVASGGAEVEVVAADKASE